jgi:hypothetical protein
MDLKKDGSLEGVLRNAGKTSHTIRRMRLWGTGQRGVEPACRGGEPELKYVRGGFVKASLSRVVGDPWRG